MTTRRTKEEKLKLIANTKHRLKTGNNPLSSCNAFNCVGRKRTYSITESINKRV